VVVSDLNWEFRIFFRGRFGVFGQFRIFFRGQFGVFGQFRIFFRAHSEYSDNSELISELYAEKIWKFIKILCFFTKIFFFSFGKVLIFRTLFSELIFGISCYGVHELFFFIKLIIIWNIDIHTCLLDSTFPCPHLFFKKKRRKMFFYKK
jgi:hypothetical protein